MAFCIHIVSYGFSDLLPHRAKWQLELVHTTDEAPSGRNAYSVYRLHGKKWEVYFTFFQEFCLRKK